jgi:hypothetical protein
VGQARHQPSATTGPLPLRPDPTDTGCRSPRHPGESS